MKKLIVLFLVLLTFSTYVFAENNKENEIDKHQNLSIEEGISKFEKEYNLKVHQPQKIPFKVDESTASYNNNHMENSDLTLEYKNNQTGQMLTIFVKQNFQKFEARVDDQEIKLKNKTDAYYRKNMDMAQIIEYKEGNVVYYVGLSPKREFTKEDVIKVAESMIN